MWGVNDMAKIQCPSDYNYWYILSYAGVEPSKEIKKYDYNEEKEELTVDIPQEELDKAFEKYNHESWLKELEQINNPKSESEIQQEIINTLGQELAQLKLQFMMGGM